MNVSVCVSEQHESVMLFPSEHFYSSRLTVGCQRQLQAAVGDFWPAGSDGPIVFVHIEGVELTVAGDDMSKTNMDEVLLVVSLSRYLSVSVTRALC